MKRYIALLRGINISGKNKVPMAELKQGFEALGYTEVKTYLNSGNVIFSREETDTTQLTSQIEEMMQDRNTKRRSSGRFAGRTIKKQTGGRRQPG